MIKQGQIIELEGQKYFVDKVTYRSAFGGGSLEEIVLKGVVEDG